MKFSIIFIFIALFMDSCSNTKMHKYPLKDDAAKTINYVPNEETAIKIAEAIWEPIYGHKIYNQKPYKASLINDSIWIVRGTLEKGKLGGVAYIEIQRSDGKILKVSHGK